MYVEFDPDPPCEMDMMSKYARTRLVSCVFHEPRRVTSDVQASSIIALKFIK